MGQVYLQLTNWPTTLFELSNKLEIHECEFIPFGI